MLFRYGLGAVLFTAALVPVGIGVRSLRTRLMPTWSGAPAVLAGLVMALALVVGVSEGLGAIGLLHLVPMTAGLAAAGGACWYLGSRRPKVQEAVDKPPSSDRASLYVAAVAGAVVGAGWSARVIWALQRGFNGTETIRYHLPKAARFVQEGLITTPHYIGTSRGSLVAFYPDTSELLHAVGMVFLGTDLLSLFFNMGFLGLALLSAWCIGRPFGVPAVSLVGALLVLGTPEIISGQAANAPNDIVGMALVMAAVGLLVNIDLERDSFAPFGVAALSVGLALGTKYTFIPVALALTVGVIAVLPRGRRLRDGSLWVLLVGLAGGFWYLRNLVAVGNPLPVLELDLGVLHLSAAPTTVTAMSIWSVMFDGAAWSDWFVPGLRAAHGPAWWAIHALALLGMGAAAVAGRTRMVRMTGAVAVVTMLAYIVVPQGLGASPEELNTFIFNVRYMDHALLLGLVLLPTVASVAGRRARWPLITYALILLIMQLDAGLWPMELLGSVNFYGHASAGSSVAGVLVGVTVLAGVLATLAVRKRRPGWRPTRNALIAASLTVIVGGALVQDFYMDRRFARFEDQYPVHFWAVGASDARIAIVGNPFQYLFYGNDLSNHVQYVATKGPHGAFTPIETCEAWREALNAGRYSHVMALRGVDQLAREETWTETDPAASLVERDFLTSLYRLDAPLDPSGCHSELGEQ